MKWNAHGELVLSGAVSASFESALQAITLGLILTAQDSSSTECSCQRFVVQKQTPTNVEKLPEAKARTLSRESIECSCARVGGTDAVGENRGVELMGVLVACKGARNRGDRQKEEVGVNLNGRSLGHDVCDLVREAVFGDTNKRSPSCYILKKIVEKDMQCFLCTITLATPAGVICL